MASDEAAFPWARALNGKTGAEIATVLTQTKPDPLAAVLASLDPEARYRAVQERIDGAAPATAETTIAN